MKHLKMLSACLLVVAVVLAPTFSASAVPTSPTDKDEVVIDLKASVEEAVARMIAEDNARMILLPQSDEQRRTGAIKMGAGIGLMALGVLLAATSSESATITSSGGGFIPDQSITVSARSNGRLVGGFGLIGGGAVLTFLGHKDRSGS